MNSPIHSCLKTTLLGALLMGICAINTDAQTHKGNVWSPVKEGDIPKVGTRYITPTEYRTFKLDVAAIENILMAAPMERTPIASVTQTVLQMPMPDGTMQSFDVVESPIMEPALAAQFPEIKTYAAVGIDNPGIYVRFDLTPQGFHAMMLIPGESTVYIDPYSFGGGDVLNYIVYDREHFHTPVDKDWACYTVAPPSHNNNHNPPPNIKMFGTCELRTYRLALSATGEYTAFHGGTLALAQAAQVTTMNRVNGVFERDMAVRMNIVANNNLIVYTNAGTDPFTNGSPGAMINENQANTDAVILSANYDIGHVFGTNSGGLAGLGVVCINGQKGRGVTGSGAPIGDAFDIDYVSHEMGHQFKCNHTFNSGSGSCGGGTRNDPTAYEPGSGVTIMAYAGICSPHNVLNNSIDHFHGGSLQEMGAFVTGGSHTCPVKTPLANGAPTITSPTAGTTYTIPASTMFFLSATATDPNPANVLTYCWETMDNGISGAQPPAANEPVGPMFRSYSPSTSPTRYFPRLSDVIAGTVSTWEVLPSATRSMDFRVTVRDNAAGGGCNDHEDVTVNVQGGTGPFVVTVPSNTGITWAGNTNQTVTWNVAGTTGAPISCANVSILLSTDGGFTYPTVLLASTPNDGSQTVLCPNTPSSTARIMVVCADNIFFDISNNNFTITAATNDYTLAATSTTASVCAPTDATYTINIGSIGGYSDPVTLSLTGAPVGTTTSFSTNPVTPVGTSTLTISNIGAAAPGTYNMTLTANSTSGTKNIGLTLVIATAPGAVTLTAPANGATNQSLTPAFTWGAVAGSGITYEIDIATDGGFTSIVQTASGLATNSYTASPELDVNTTYFWRVRAVSACGNGTYSSTFSFTTGNTACTTIAATTVPVAISDVSTSTVTSTIPVSLPGGATITDVNILNLTGTHTYVSDLTVQITSPVSTVVNLFSALCGSNQNFNLNFDASGALYTTIPCPPTSGGTFQPQGNLGNFNGQNPSGNWTLSVTDGFNQDGGSLNTWSLNVCYSIAVPCAVTASTTVTNATCNGSCNGTATAVPSGGSSPYTFVWSNGATSATTTGLCAGTHTVTITDAAACTVTATAVISQPSAVTATASNTNATCNGSCNGTATATGSGGSSPYTFVWTTGATTSAITGLCAGTYTVTVRDANNCSATAAITVTEPSAVTITTSTVPTTCTPNSGSANASATGGSSPYTFAWSNGTSGANNPNLNAGTYTVTATDAAGCAVTATAAVADGCTPCTLTGTTTSTNVTCNGSCNGTATAVPSGGSSPYTFVWSNGATSATTTGLCAGTHTVTITDAAACNVTATAVISQPSAVTATASNTNATCNGSCNGTATATGSGGSSPYTFAWTTGATTSAITGLCAGTYTVTVRDANNCSATAAITVTEPSAVTITTSTVPTTCAPNSGTASASATGGSSPYTFAWSNGTSGANNPNLNAGTYTVTATDAAGCAVTATAAVADDCVGGLSATATINHVSCFGACNGSITTTASGGTAPYTYLWTNGATTANITGLCNGNYGLTLTDAAAATVSYNYTINQPAVLSATTVPTNTCFNSSNGSINLTVSGGTAPYSFNWAGGVTTEDRSNLTVGTYVVTVTDANGCSTTASATINQNPAITSTVNKTNVACSGACTGTATINASGGSGGFSYLWSNSANSQTTATATGLCYGAYNVVITDAIGCTVQRGSIFILQPPAISVTPTITHATCSTQGSISVSVSGGTGTKTLLWSTGATNASITALNGATYGLTVTDAAGCQKVFSYFVDDLCYTIAVTKNDITDCTPTCTGDATVTATDGVAPYTYLWSNGQTTATATGLCQQTYNVTVTDANNVVRTANISITHNPLTATFSSTPTSCNGYCDGTATLSPTGAQAPYTYLWSPIADNQTTQTATGLCYGAYHVTITSANGCSFVRRFINVYQNPAIAITVGSTPSSCANDGTATATATGGVAPLSFAWSGGGNTASITGLTPGAYIVTVTDAIGCSKTKSVTVGNACGAKPTENGGLLAEESILNESMPTNENVDINETLRLNDFMLVDVFNVYPNPNNGQFTIDIQLVTETDARLRIHDLLGRTVLEQNLQGQSFQVAIDAKTWADGAYFVQLISPNGQTTRKVLISNE